MKRYIKEHKIVVVAVILLIIIIIASFFLKNVLFSNSENAVYGDRLKGIDEVKITTSQEKDLISNLENESAVKSAKYSLQGKIINVVITVNDDIGVDTAKSIANKTLESFDDDQKKYYDFQVFLKKEKDASNFPIIGYKQNTKDSFSFTKDRAEG